MGLKPVNFPLIQFYDIWAGWNAEFADALDCLVCYGSMDSSGQLTWWLQVDIPTDPKDLSEDAIGQIMAHFCTRDLSKNTAEGDLGWAAALSLGSTSQREMRIHLQKKWPPLIVSSGMHL